MNTPCSYHVVVDDSVIDFIPCTAGERRVHPKECARIVYDNEVGYCLQLLADYRKPALLDMIALASVHTKILQLNRDFLKELRIKANHE
jgi:hypothetical protein